LSSSENQALPLAAATRRFDLSGRVVVITGASKGIGRELTILLADTGALVVPTVRTDDDAAAVASEARSHGLTVHPERLDVRDVASINEAVSRIVAAHGRIDVLVNNAGLGFARAAFDVTEADWDEMMAVNLRGAFFMSQAVARTMVSTGRGGRIVNISSQGGLVGLPDAAVYCASKGGPELGEPWPWPCRVVQRTELTGGRATFRIELHAREAMPAAVGWHPWFVRRLAGTPSSAELELDVEPGLMWAKDATGLPSGRLTAPAPRPWDYCFRDLRSDPVVRWPGELELTVSSNCEDWIIYDMEDDGVCVEPWTAPPNSLNMPNPRIVTPGAPLMASMTWTWR
jgi:hypothetical protein